MEKVEFNWPVIVEKVRAKAVESPDYIYQKVARKSEGEPWEIEPACWNVYNGQPSCIVGHGYVDSGIPVEWLEKYFNTDSVNGIVEELELFDSVEEYPNEIGWLITVQAKQDTGTPWGKAVEMANEEYPMV